MWTLWIISSLPEGSPVCTVPLKQSGQDILMSRQLKEEAAVTHRFTDTSTLYVVPSRQLRKEIGQPTLIGKRMRRRMGFAQGKLSLGFVFRMRLVHFGPLSHCDRGVRPGSWAWEAHSISSCAARRRSFNGYEVFSAVRYGQKFIAACNLMLQGTNIDFNPEHFPVRPLTVADFSFLV